MSEPERDDFHHLRLNSGINLHIHHTRSFKSTTVDIFVQELLQEKHNTWVALVGRLLERGTCRFPDMRSLNCCIDEMYGASFAVDVDQLGDRQVIHVSLEVLDSRFLPEKEDLLKRAIDFLHQILYHPVREGTGFRRAYLQQEKKALELNIASLFNDKTAYAQRRCIETMCAGEPFGLPPFGDPRDFRDINASNLLEFHYQLLKCNPIDVFICGWVDADRLVPLCEELFAGERAPQGVFRPAPPLDASGEYREIFETQEVSQGRLVLGYRTRASILDEEFPALVLFNALFGEDTYSRLFKHVREETGMAYFISSQLEPICGLMFVDAGIEREDYRAVRHRIGEQMEVVREERIAADELDQVRALLIKRLMALSDSPEELVRFCYRRSAVGQKGSRWELRERLEAVRREDIGRVARKVDLDTAFFLCGRKEDGVW